MSKGAIKNGERYLAAALRRRTERFDGCFPRSITLGDIDSFVEINNHFLFLEWKVGNQIVNAGQWKALIRLSRQPNTCVWILWTTEDGFITHGQRLGVHHRRVPTDENAVATRIKEWCAESDVGHVVGVRMGGAGA